MEVEAASEIQDLTHCPDGKAGSQWSHTAGRWQGSRVLAAERGQCLGGRKLVRAHHCPRVASSQPSTSI